MIGKTMDFHSPDNSFPCRSTPPPRTEHDSSNERTFNLALHNERIVLHPLIRSVGIKTCFNHMKRGLTGHYVPLGDSIMRIANSWVLSVATIVLGFTDA